MQIKAVFTTAEGTHEAACKLQALRVKELVREPDSCLLRAVVDENNADMARSVIASAGGVIEGNTGIDEIWLV